jgi:hypothetical protein
MNNWELIRKLKKYKVETDSHIAKIVIDEALYYGNVEWFFKDIMNYGCISWMVWILIYYTDTHKFFDDNYYEIEEIRLELQENGCLEKYPEWDYKNHFAWLSFEEVARWIADNIGIER